MFSLNDFLLNIIAKRNGINLTGGVEQVVKEVPIKRKEIDDLVEANKNIKDEKILYEKFINYSEALERMILAKRLESGVSTLIFFIYTIMGNIAGMIMSILALLTTTGLVGHIILLVSILGGVVGLFFALNSMKRERNFIVSLSQMP